MARRGVGLFGELVGDAWFPRQNITEILISSRSIQPGLSTVGYSLEKPQ